MAAESKAKILRDAEKYVLHGKLPQAVNEYLKIVKADPTDVLTLNTIGDLYLRQKKKSEAKKYFLLVAESYGRNNFLLKAIAVYKKILGDEPDEIEINKMLASLYAKQGLLLNARNQYLHMSEICERQGRKQDSIEALEKCVELDPFSAAGHMKLAEIYLSSGDQTRAHDRLVGAARAYARSKEYGEAMGAYQRALSLNPLDTDALSGFLDVSMDAEDISLVLAQLQETVRQAPENPDFQEMLARANLFAKRFDDAETALNKVVSRDPTRFMSFFDLSKGYLSLGEFDKSIQCLDNVKSIIVSQRETDRSEEICKKILEINPHHVASLRHLAYVYSSINERRSYLETLDRIADTFYHSDRPEEALEPLLQLLENVPESEKHLTMHRESFLKAFPDKPYVPPGSQVPIPGMTPKPELTSEDIAFLTQQTPKATAGSTLVEVDLLLNYGMNDKALAQLMSLRAQNPGDMEVRKRLASLYREMNLKPKAAEECVVLSILCRRDNDSAEADRLWLEARSLAPEVASEDLDLNLFAFHHGIGLEESAIPQADFGSPSVLETPPPVEVELDLSGELSGFFFQDSEPAGVSGEAPGSHTHLADSADSPAPKEPPAVSIESELQEVDFYIRLGFLDEARNKLNDMAIAYPDHPDLTPRLQQLHQGPTDRPPSRSEPSIALTPGAAHSEPETIAARPEHADEASVLRFDLGLDQFMEKYGSEPESAPSAPFDNAEPQEAAPIALGNRKSAETPPIELDLSALDQEKKNTWPPDLVSDAESISEEEISREDFETHFNTGIAFREMSLIEDAIREFEIAGRTIHPDSSPRQVIQCCGMLSLCLLELGKPGAAIAWCDAGLNIEDIQPHEAMALRYDLAIACAQVGDRQRALESMKFILEIDPGYRDVAQRAEAIRGGKS